MVLSARLRLPVLVRLCARSRFVTVRRACTSRLPGRLSAYFCVGIFCVPIEICDHGSVHISSFSYFARSLLLYCVCTYCMCT